LYFALFAGSLCMWSAQAIYARAFYAAGNTLTPMVASTLVAAASVPLYGFLYHRMGVVGLVLASDTGIVVQTVVLAVLLDIGKLVQVRGLEYAELGRALLAAIAGGSELYLLERLLPGAGTFHGDILQMACGTVAWFVTCWVILYATGSTLPQQLISRFRGKNASSPAAA
ncbi:MAG TPA: lipid II flippase MurJ, partial [Acidobacteriaceae bacterium]|nr:lipid II flippase MurJ [Acidobacteriaceae bacterium]